jgi:hypothetical protein
MKFNYLATILMGTVALASNFNAGPANAIDCTNTKTISVPWNWQLSQSGDFDASVTARNVGSPYTTIRDPDTFSGAYIVNLLFDEPSNYCERLGNVPTQTSLKIKGFFTGLLATAFVSDPTVPREEGPFAGAEASVNILPGFVDQKLFAGTKDIDEKSERLITVGDGNRTLITGNLEAFAYKGFVLGGGGFSVANAQLFVTGEFIEPTSGMVDYTVPVPEPLTMLASATALGFGALFKRQHSNKNPKKS